MMGYDIADLFWGVPQGYLGVLMTLSFVAFPLLFLKGNEIFMAPTRVGALTQGGWKRFHHYIEEEHGDLMAYPGLTHVFFSLLVCILGISFLGIMAYFPALGANWKLWVSLALPFWMIAMIFTWSGNSGTFAGFAVDPELPWALNAVLLMTELISIAARPVTLSLRIWVNVTIGQVGMHLLGQMFGGYVSLGIDGVIGAALCWFFGTALITAEMCVLCIQTFIFIKLLLIYCSEYGFSHANPQGYH
uniref:ATP synthase F0 subunit 6 n=1 Tax=Bankia gouldi TaxID=300633 RepID=UPI0020296BD6|nr:ATP synthase F0 subunit 6 [Bankia gouldi]UPX89068.1 ATP synthase F0 subunit 6 [Bankia gouldi]